MSGHDVYYGRDYMLTFLKAASERNNYLGDEAQQTLSKVSLTDDSKAQCFAFLDQRFAEFSEHGFIKSKKII
jgi:hypothetical protein